MKKLLLGILAVITMLSLVACGEKQVTVNEPEKVETTQNVVEEATSQEVTSQEVETEEPVEQVGVGNTDEGMVVLALEGFYKQEFGDDVEEVVPVKIKVYSKEEIDANELLKDYTINEGDIVFEAQYDLKIVEGYEDMMKFAPSTGEIDGQWVRNIFDVGIVRNNGENGYLLDAFGAAF